MFKYDVRMVNGSKGCEVRFTVPFADLLRAVAALLDEKGALDVVPPPSTRKPATVEHALPPALGFHQLECECSHIANLHGRARGRCRASGCSCPGPRRTTLR